MNPHTNYAAVGFFLLVGVAVMVVLVVWLGQAADTTPRTGYVVRIESNVNGLSNGSIVRYLGVNVGSVVDIQLYTDTRPFVDVFIEIEEGLPIDDSTYATLVSQGVTGIANIDLASDLKLARPLETHESGIPIIPFRATGLSAMLAGLDHVDEAHVSRAHVRVSGRTGSDARANGLLGHGRSPCAAIVSLLVDS